MIASYRDVETSCPATHTREGLSLPWWYRISRKSSTGKAMKSARFPASSVPLSSNPSARAARQVSALRVSALESFCCAESTDACMSRSPIGADPGFQSLAITSEQPWSRIFRAGAKCIPRPSDRSEEHTSELQSRENLVCRLLLEKKNMLIS